MLHICIKLCLRKETRQQAFYKQNKNTMIQLKVFRKGEQVSDKLVSTKILCKDNNDLVLPYCWHRRKHHWMNLLWEMETTAVHVKMLALVSKCPLSEINGLIVELAHGHAIRQTSWKPVPLQPKWKPCFGIH